MRIYRWASVLGAAALLAACGGDDDPDRGERGKAPQPAATVTKAEYVDRVDEACRRAMKRWDDPLAVERELPESPIYTTVKGRAKTLAREIRGHRALVRDIVAAVEAKPRPEGGGALLERYARQLNFAETEMENEELIVRQDWNRQSNAPVIRRHFRNARRLAKRYGFEDCARF